MWTLYHGLPANTRRCLKVVLMLGRRRRLWANIKTTLSQRLVFAVIHQSVETIQQKRDTNAVIMLVQRLWRLPNISLLQHNIYNTDPMLYLYWANVVKVGSTLKQILVSILFCWDIICSKMQYLFKRGRCEHKGYNGHNVNWWSGSWANIDRSTNRNIPKENYTWKDGFHW